jgi:DNA-binding LacI/PurR family transcriptional regulator
MGYSAKATVLKATSSALEHKPQAEMGRSAVSLLGRLMERQSFETLHVELATRLVVRDSTAPPENG